MPHYVCAEKPELNVLQGVIHRVTCILHLEFKSQTWFLCHLPLLFHLVCCEIDSHSAYMGWSGKRIEIPSACEVCVSYE